MKGKGLRKIIGCILAGMLITSFPLTGMAEILRNETVYVNLNHQGSPVSTKVITHISGSTNEEYHIEYGDLEDVRVLSKGDFPEIEGDLIKWDVKNLRDEDIYYEGRLEKELPLDIEIQYSLNGLSIDPKDLAGKSGNIEIKIIIKNSKELTTQIQVPMSLDIFKDIKAKKATTSVVGKTMTVVFTHLPMGDEIFIIEAKGTNIELDPILISSTMANMSFGEDIGGDIKELVDGIEEMSKATKELEDGSKEIGNGINFLKNGLESLSQGMSKLFSGLKEISKNLKTIVGGFSQFNMGLEELNREIISMSMGVDGINNGLNQLNDQGKEIENGIEGLSGGLYEIGGALEGVSEGLEGLNFGHGELVQLAGDLINSEDPRVRALAQGVIYEGEAINKLAQGTKETKIGLDSIGENSKILLYGYKEYSKGLDNLTFGFNEFNEGMKELPNEINNMYQGHSELVKGLQSLDKGFDAGLAGGDELNTNIKKIPQEVLKLKDGQEKLTEGLNLLNKEGFNKINKGIDNFPMMDELDEEKNYPSFIDKRNDKNSNCQFIMQTPGIKVKAEKVVSVIGPKESKNIIQRFLDLFKFKL